MPELTKAPEAARIEELKQWLRIEDGREEPLLHQLLRAATEVVESHLGFLLIQRELEWAGRLCDGAVRLAGGPVQSLVSVTVEGTDEALAARIEPGAGAGAIVIVDGGADTSVRIRYVAGSASDWNGLPEAVRLGVLRLAAHMYAHRDADDDVGIPIAVIRLLAPFRIRRMR
jgi:uncharacterized phiE125 gp8 family phage protein